MGGTGGERQEIKPNKQAGLFSFILLIVLSIFGFAQWQSGSGRRACGTRPRRGRKDASRVFVADFQGTAQTARHRGSRIYIIYESIFAVVSLTFP